MTCTDKIFGKRKVAAQRLLVRAISSAAFLRGEHAGHGQGRQLCVMVLSNACDTTARSLRPLRVIDELPYPPQRSSEFPA
ncbi:hypothetical protein ABZ553_02730 [Streptomyces sparsogenes]|uniref:hypothetical protein n=1 Tax=Streptomyces sparsogenes TaxID=67365 RepID=UPI00340F32CD